MNRVFLFIAGMFFGILLPLFFFNYSQMDSGFFEFKFIDLLKALVPVFIALYFAKVFDIQKYFYQKRFDYYAKTFDDIETRINRIHELSKEYYFGAKESSLAVKILSEIDLFDVLTVNFQHHLLKINEEKCKDLNELLGSLRTKFLEYNHLVTGDYFEENQPEFPNEFRVNIDILYKQLYKNLINIRQKILD